MLQDFKNEKLSFFKLMSYGVYVCRKNFGYIVLTALLVYIPLYILVSIPFSSISHIDVQILLNELINGFYSNETREYFKYYSLCVIVIMVFQPLAVSGITYITGQALENKTVSMAGILEATIEKWWKLVVTSIIYYAVISLSSLLIIPAVYFSVAYYYYSNVVAVSDKWGISALRESSALIRGHFFSSLLFLATIIILSSITGQVVGIAVFLILGELAYPVIADVVSNTICIYYQVVIALWFWNMKLQNKKE